MDKYVKLIKVSVRLPTLLNILPQKNKHEETEGEFTLIHFYKS